MSVEFIDTNILIYAHDSSATRKHGRSRDLLSRLFEEKTGALSTQVLVEFCAAATRKLAMTAGEAGSIVGDLGGWIIHRPTHMDILGALKLQRRHKLSWWDALILISAIETGAHTFWTEDLNAGQRFGQLVVRNPYA